MSDLKRTSLRRSPRVKKTTALILGYTRAGRPVIRPAHEAPDSADHAKEAFADWARGEHKDVYRILAEHSEREPDREISAWCEGWAAVHKILGGR